LSSAHNHRSVGVAGRKGDKVNISVLAAAVALLLGVLATPFGTAAQQTGRVYRLGFLYGIPVPPGAAVFEQALRELGWVKGQNIAIEYRSAEGYLDRLPALAAELVALRVNLIIANSAPETKAAREATRSIPIVFVVHGDPVGTGDVQSLARPGGNVTGLSQIHPELSAKQLDVLKQIVPRLGRIAVLWNAEVPAKAGDWRELQSAGQALGVRLQSREVRRPGDLEGAFAAIRNDRPDALLILGDPMLYTLRASIAQFAEKERLPAMYPWKGAVQAGGLISYGADGADLSRRAAWYVDRILKGANPADLPVQQPIKFELAVNLNAAKSLGMPIPPSLLLRVDSRIE
jgi:putative ABC transport system substrate-binding protein